MYPPERRGGRDDVVIHRPWRKPERDTRPILWAFFIIFAALVVAFFIDVSR